MGQGSDPDDLPKTHGQRPVLSLQVPALGTLLCRASMWKLLTAVVSLGRRQRVDPSPAPPPTSQPAVSGSFLACVGTRTLPSLSVWNSASFKAILGFLLPVKAKVG